MRDIIGFLRHNNMVIEYTNERGERCAHAVTDVGEARKIRDKGVKSE